MIKQSINNNLELETISEENIFDNPMVKYVTQFIKLTEEEAIDFMSTIKIEKFKKGDYLLKEGQIKDLCTFVLKGCVRHYYIVDGEEITTNFYTEGQPVQAHDGATKNEPSNYYLVCNEDCTLSVGSLIPDDEIIDRFPKIARASSASYESLLAKQNINLANFIIKSPEQRYIHLLETRPELVDRVPQYQLASYLGIKPESLSRIRKRMATIKK